MSKHYTTEQPHLDGLKDIFQCEGAFADYGMAEASYRIDSKADRDWFERHPGQISRQRPPSIRELRATGAPPTAIVCVFLRPDGVIIRRVISSPHLRTVPGPQTFNN